MRTFATIAAVLTLMLDLLSAVGFAIFSFGNQSGPPWTWFVVQIHAVHSVETVFVLAMLGWTALLACLCLFFAWSGSWGIHKPQTFSSATPAVA